MRKKILSILGVFLVAIFSLTMRAISEETTAKEKTPVKENINQEQPLNKEDVSKKDEGKDAAKKEEVDDLYAQVELFSYALTTIQSEYVDQKQSKELIYGSLRGMLASLDPHSQFLDADEYTELKTETQGKFGGLGIEISIRDGLLTVVTPIED